MTEMLNVSMSAVPRINGGTSTGIASGATSQAHRQTLEQTSGPASSMGSDNYTKTHLDSRDCIQLTAEEELLFRRMVAVIEDPIPDGKTSVVKKTSREIKRYVSGMNPSKRYFFAEALVARAKAVKPPLNASVIALFEGERDIAQEVRLEYLAEQQSVLAAANRVRLDEPNDITSAPVLAPELERAAEEARFIACRILVQSMRSKMSKGEYVADLLANTSSAVGIRIGNAIKGLFGTIGIVASMASPILRWAIYPVLFLVANFMMWKLGLSFLLMAPLFILSLLFGVSAVFSFSHECDPAGRQEVRVAHRWINSGLLALIMLFNFAPLIDLDDGFSEYIGIVHEMDDDEREHVVGLIDTRKQSIAGPLWSQVFGNFGRDVTWVGQPDRLVNVSVENKVQASGLRKIHLVYDQKLIMPDDATLFDLKAALVKQNPYGGKDFDVKNISKLAEVMQADITAALEKLETIDEKTIAEALALAAKSYPYFSVKVDRMTIVVP